MFIGILRMVAVHGQPVSCFGLHHARQMCGVFIAALLMLFSVTPDMSARTCFGYAWTLE